MAEAVTDTNGFIEIKGNRLSKPGVFQYLGAEIGAPEPDRVYNVFRPPEELADPECAQSFKLQPWIIDHKMLGKKFGTAPELKGIHGVIGEDVYYDDELGWLCGNIKIFSDRLEDEIAGGKDELSLGFACEYNFDETGVYDGTRYDVTQRKIRGNHLASVDASRMGVAVMDHAMDHMTITLDTTEAVYMDGKGKKDENATPGTDQDRDLAEMMAMLKEMAPMMKEYQEMMGMMKDMMGATGMSGMSYEENPDDMAMDQDKEADKDADKDSKKGDGMDASVVSAAVAAALKPLTETVTALSKDLQAVKATQAGMDSALLDTIAKRDELAIQLSRHIGTFDHRNKTLAQVAEYGAEKLGVPCEKGQELAAITAYMHNRPVDVKLVAVPTGQDGATGASPVSDYLTGGTE